MQRDHSRSLDDITSPVAGPGYVHESNEPKPDWCKVQGCKLMGHPQNQFLCTQHFTEDKLRKQRANNERKYHQQQKTLPMQRVEHWLKNHEGFRDPHANGFEDSSEMTSGNNLTRANPTPKCRNDSCKQQGNLHFQGHCTSCFLKLDMNGDTEPLERPHFREEKKEDDQIGKEEDRNTDQTLKNIKDTVNIDNTDLDSLQGLQSVSDEKQEGNRIDSQDFNKCKKDECNRLAPPTGTDGFCRDCFLTVLDSPPIEPSAPQNYTEPGLRVDTASAAAPISNPPPHYIRNVSLQSFPSLPVKQAYPSKNYQPTASGTIDAQALKEIKCATSRCSGIYVNLDKNNPGLCFKCLKERASSSLESGNPEIQTNVNMQGQPPPASGEAQHQMRKLSGGRRSGRKRHTIAIPPSVPSGTHNMEVHRDGNPCVSPLCNKNGSSRYRGFCKDCHEWMCLKIEQFDDIQGTEQQGKTNFFVLFIFVQTCFLSNKYPKDI